MGSFTEANKENEAASFPSDQIWSAAFMPLHHRYDRRVEPTEAQEIATLKRPEGRAPFIGQTRMNTDGETAKYPKHANVE